MHKLTIKILPDEYWYGMSVSYGTELPISEESNCSIDISINKTTNQVSPLLVSNAGRYIWSEKGYKLDAANGELIISAEDEVNIYDGYENLKESYLQASKMHFPPNGKLPAENFFKKPQYNTWIELFYDQTQEDIIRYAKSILENDLPPGILMIDDGWNDYYGYWDFNRLKFPEPKKMIEELHSLGFEVMLWTCPFISADSPEFRELRDEGYLVKTKEGTPALREWWNGFSAVLDFTNPGAVKWFKGKKDWLINEYKVDGFKFDAGDAHFYSNEDVTYAPTTPNGQSELWAKFGLNYEYNEYRTCFKCAGLPLVQRLDDKSHVWGDGGVASLVPNQLTQGILGYAYTCPDMIGGGQIISFWDPDFKLDEELFVRYAQAAALMPMMQFSAAPWRVLSEENSQLCVAAAKLHDEFTDYIYELAEHSSQTGEPIVRFMEYEFPEEGFAKVTNQFMLGDKYLVAPVTTKGDRKHQVVLPTGTWKYVDRSEHSGGKVTVNAPLSVLPYFEKL